MNEGTGIQHKAPEGQLLSTRDIYLHQSRVCHARVGSVFFTKHLTGHYFLRKSKLSKKHAVKQHKSLGFYFNYYKQKVPKITKKKKKKRERGKEEKRKEDVL